MNYNIKSRGPLEKIRKWRDETGIPIKVFENYDGGGFKFCMVEFAARDDLESFIGTDLGFGSPWGEDENSGFFELG